VLLKQYKTLKELMKFFVTGPAICIIWLNIVEGKMNNISNVHRALYRYNITEGFCFGHMSFDIQFINIYFRLILKVG
jgi:hypothetical protein